MDIIAPLALLGAVIAGIAAGFMFWSGQNASRAGRGALFNTERQVALDRVRRSRMASIALGATALLLLGINLVGTGVAPIVSVPSPTPTRTPRPTPSLAPATREVLIETIMPTATPTPPLARAVVANAGEPGLRLRAEPNGQEIDFLKDGTVLDVLPDPVVTTADGITWQKVRDPQGRVGWVATAYIVNQ